MLARAELPARYAEWNARWGAPAGHAFARLLAPPVRRWPVFASLAGPFSHQLNNTTRAFEYPWAFEALQVKPGLDVLEVGGGLSGLQFVLARHGCRVRNVDPGEKARGRGWPVGPEAMALLNRRYGTAVELSHCFIDEAGLADASVDRVVSVSVLEHIPWSDLVTLLAHLRRVLRPGGLAVFTVDLFLDLSPFTASPRNEFGENVSVRALVEASGLLLQHGRPEELCGYDAFRPAEVLARRAEWLVAEAPPVAVQTLVLKKA